MTREEVLFFFRRNKRRRSRMHVTSFHERPFLPWFACVSSSSNHLQMDGLPFFLLVILPPHPFIPAIQIQNWRRKHELAIEHPGSSWLDLAYRYDRYLLASCLPMGETLIPPTPNPRAKIYQSCILFDFFRPERMEFHLDFAAKVKEVCSSLVDWRKQAINATACATSVIPKISIPIKIQYPAITIQ